MAGNARNITARKSTDQFPRETERPTPIAATTATVATTTLESRLLESRKCPRVGAWCGASAGARIMPPGGGNK